MPLDILNRPKRLTQIAVAGSAALLATALVAQYGFGWLPCELCLYQRYPYVAALVLGALALALWDGAAARAAAGLAGLGFAVGAGVAVLHTGVEFGWWTGPTACSGGVDTGGTTEELLARLRDAPLVRCDARQSFFLGLSFTNWNFLASSGLALAFAAAALGGAPRRPA